MPQTVGLFSLQILHICLDYMSSELFYPLGWIFCRKSVIWVVFDQQKFIIFNMICLVAIVTVQKFDEWKDPQILFSVKFMSQKADEMRKIFILHPKIRKTYGSED